MCEMLHGGSTGSNLNSAEHPPRHYALFVSSPTEKTPFWFQKSRPDSLVVWDYHVLLVSQQQTPKHHAVAYDLDTVLPFPSRFDQYIDKSLMSTLALRRMLTSKNVQTTNKNERESESESESEEDEAEERQRHIRELIEWFDQIRFRLVTSEQFYRNFSSDRSHMIDERSGEWLATPPTYPCIRQQASVPMNLMKYRNMIPTEEDEQHKDLDSAPFGRVMNMKELLSFFNYDYDELASEYPS